MKVELLRLFMADLLLEIRVDTSKIYHSALNKYVLLARNASRGYSEDVNSYGPRNNILEVSQPPPPHSTI